MLSALENTDPAIEKVRNQLAKLYDENLRDLEAAYQFEKTHDWPLFHGDLTAPPMIIAMGQYSTGKSTFIRYLVGQDFPGLRIAAEPTTDNVVSVMFGEKDQIIPGNMLVIDDRFQYQSLKYMEDGFFDHFYAARCSAPVLKHVCFVDTPGILGVEKNRANRGYSYEQIARWFGNRADMIILFFDAASLDINDEYRKVIHQVSTANTNKIKIVLNKADSFTGLELMRIYGSLMWALGKVFDCPEAVVVYVGSFHDGEVKNNDLKTLFSQSMTELVSDVAQLPSTSAINKINDIVKRITKVKSNALILDTIANTDGMKGKVGKSWRKKVGKYLPTVLAHVQKKYKIVTSHMPKAEDFLKNVIAKIDSTDIPLTLDHEKISALDRMLSTDMKKLMRSLTSEDTLEEIEGEVVEYSTETTRPHTSSLVIGDSSVPNSDADE